MHVIWLKGLMPPAQTEAGGVWYAARAEVVLIGHASDEFLTDRANLSTMLTL